MMVQWDFGMAYAISFSPALLSMSIYFVCCFVALCYLSYLARMHSIVCVTTEYPRTPPLFVVVLELSSGQREPYTIQVKVRHLDKGVGLDTPRAVMFGEVQ